MLYPQAYHLSEFDLISTIFSEICPGCGKTESQENPKMASVPHGAFAAIKVKKNEEKRAKHKFYDPSDLITTNYNSKYMDSIWGMYNRYSVHNLKKMMEFEIVIPPIGCQKRDAHLPSGLNPLEYQITSGNKGNIFRFSIEKLSYLPM